MKYVNICLLFCALFLFSGKIYAQEAPSSVTPLTVNELKVMAQPEPSLRKPVCYSLSMMAIGYPALFMSDEIAHPRWKHFRSAMRHDPEWENDSYVYNFILHPLWGSETYLRAREAGYSIVGSTLFSYSASFFWEFFVESWSQRPSIQDLIFTSGIGWMIGEVRYKLKQNMNPGYYWLVDPINTVLENCNISFGAAKSKDIYSRIAVKKEF